MIIPHNLEIAVRRTLRVFSSSISLFINRHFYEFIQWEINSPYGKRSYNYIRYKKLTKYGKLKEKNNLSWVDRMKELKTINCILYCFYIKIMNKPLLLSACKPYRISLTFHPVNSRAYNLIGYLRTTLQHQGMTKPIIK